jgi:hypothetical protein
MMINRLAVCAAVLAVLAGAGCARAEPSSNAGAPASSQPAPSQPALSQSAPSQPAVASSAGGSQTLTGEVAAGVEPDCLLLEGVGGPHLLVFEDKALRGVAQVGRRVTVVGRAEPGMMTTCQQGTPFMVTSISPS